MFCLIFSFNLWLSWGTMYWLRQLKERRITAVDTLVLSTYKQEGLLVTDSKVTVTNRFLFSKLPPPQAAKEG